MDKLNEFEYQQLENLLNRLIEKKVYEILDELGVEASSFGKITNIDKTEEDGSKVVRASVKLSDGSVVENLYNAGEKNLSVGDMVKIYGSKTDLSNRYIGIKYER